MKAFELFLMLQSILKQSNGNYMRINLVYGGYVVLLKKKMEDPVWNGVRYTKLICMNLVSWISYHPTGTYTVIHIKRMGMCRRRRLVRDE